MAEDKKSIKFLEKNLEDLIYETPNHLLRQKGLDIYGKKIRQVSIGNYGIADLITYSTETQVYKRKDGTLNYMEQILHITIYELKKGSLEFDALRQAARYATGVREYIELRSGVDYNGYDINFSIVLIGSKVNLETIGYLSTFSSNLFHHDRPISSYKFQYDFDGIRFIEVSGVHLPNNGFKL